MAARRYYVVSHMEDGRTTVFGPFDREEAKRQAAAHRDQLGFRAKTVGIRLMTPAQAAAKRSS
jgi:hypothetical protein